MDEITGHALELLKVRALEVVPVGRDDQRVRARGALVHVVADLESRADLRRGVLRRDRVESLAGDRVAQGLADQSGPDPNRGAT